MTPAPRKSFGFYQRAEFSDAPPTGRRFHVLPPKPDPPRDTEKMDREERYYLARAEARKKAQAEAGRAWFIEQRKQADYMLTFVERQAERVRRRAEENLARKAQRQHMVDSFLRKRGDINEAQNENQGG